MDIIKTIASEKNLRPEQVEKTVALIDDGNTVPFISRYRKEVTGGLDDTQLRDLYDRLTYLRSLEKRKEEVTNLITEMGLMTDDVASALSSAVTLTEVEDIYRPFKPKRKTRASIAREKGLAPLAALILSQPQAPFDLISESSIYINEEKNVLSTDDAIAGAKDIIAEDVSDNAEYRKKIRKITSDCGSIRCVKAKDEDSVYSGYYDFSGVLSKLPGFRYLAINRGENEGFLKVSVEISKDLILNYLYNEIVTNISSPCHDTLVSAIVDSYDRLIAPSIEREIRSDLFDSASEGAIRNFSVNLSHLLMCAPLKGKTVLGLDPGYRTGCKLAVVDKTGKVLDTAVIYPTKPQERIAESAAKVSQMIEKYNVDIVSIGNGTASKESEIFIADTIKKYGGKVKYSMTSEAGASVYSASKLAADEFPDFDVTQRSAVSIARRIQDPLAELVKIEPRSIGVGQYQHDMKPARLNEALTGVVEDCVNKVGVDLNTASHSLLSYISGINATSASNIVKYREENGEFTGRSQLLKVPKIGAKAYAQAAGFLRVTSSKEVLDNTGVHPESYPVAKALLKKYGYTEKDLKQGALSGLYEKIKDDIDSLCDELSVGKPTLIDIIKELEKPGRDLRDSLPEPELRSDIMDMNDLKPGMKLHGTVRNVIDFGAFVDIGVHQDGLVHISQICDRFIKHPSEVLSVGDRVEVTVLSVDTKKGKISLTMKNK